MEPIRVTHDAPAECPNADVFVQDVFARTDRVRLATDTEPSRRFEVTLERLGDRYRAVLRITGLDGTAGQQVLFQVHPLNTTAMAISGDAIVETR